MRPRRLAALGAAALLALAGPAGADPDGPGRAKPETEAKAIARVTRAFLGLDGYAVTCDVQGGLGDPATVEITKPSVAEAYRGEARGPVAKVEGGAEAYRLRTGTAGAVREGAGWKGILATDAGRKVERLFVRPEAILAEVARHKAAARWVPPAAAPGGAPAPGAEASEADQGDEGVDAAGTRARGDEAAEGPPSATAPLSHHLRVEGASTTAVEHFNRIQSSGCFGGG